MKILLGMSPVGGHLAGIQYGLKQIGVDSDLVYYKNNKYGMPSDQIVWKEGFSNKQKILSMYDFFKFANSYYDVIHFAFGSSFFMFPKHITFLDLPFISKNIKIFTTFNGCDIRQKQKMSLLDNFCACNDSFCGKGSCGFGWDTIKQLKVNMFNKYSKKTYVTTPDLKIFSPSSDLLFQPKHTFFNYDYIGVRDNFKLKVVHAPSNTTIKGTEEIIKACGRLKDKLELILVKNMSNIEALEIYKSADLVIDQLKVGWYGGFAVEVMRMGKPVIAYMSDISLSKIDLSLKNDLPIINANKQNIEIVLIDLIKNKEKLQLLSIKSYEYVNKYHNPINISKKLLTDYRLL
ncbi:MAG: hypothetical protein WC390_03630 [Sulfurimonas sp.]|jgi:hypothetical protein